MGTPHTSKPARILAGYGVDGSVQYVRVTIDHDELICPECEGTGRVDYVNCRDGFEYRSTGICEDCDGRGVLKIEIEETEQ